MRRNPAGALSGDAMDETIEDRSLADARSHAGIGELELLLGRMTVLATALAEPGGPDQRPWPEPAPLGWWVLAVGARLDHGSLELRDRSRDNLRRELEQRGIRLKEYVWIWDETNRAQVLLRSFGSRDLAEAFAGAMEMRGLRVRICREWDSDK